MKVVHGYQDVPDDARGAALAIGNFDGVHRGHQALAREAIAQAKKAGTASGVLLFEPHPREFFHPEEPHFRLTPLAEKLGLKAGHTVAVVAEPDGFRALLDPIPDDVAFRASLRGRADLALLFVTERKVLEAKVEAAGRAVFPSGAIWVAWPKRASKVPTDVTEDVVRAHFAGINHGGVTRYAADNMRVLNFLLEDSLGGGGSASLKTDAQGKTHGLGLLRMTLDVPDDVLASVEAGR